MKIVFLLTVGLERPSGLRYAGLARGLARRGHKMTVLALHPDFDQARPRRYRSDGVDVHYVGQMHARKVGSAPGRFSPLRLLSVVVRSSAALAWAAAAADGDCIHLGKPQPINGMAALLASRVRPRPLYLDCDDYEAGSNRFSADWQRALFAWWEDRIPTRAAGVTVNTAFLAERVAGLGVAREHIVHVPNGVDLQTFRPQPTVLVDALRTAMGLRGRRVVAYVGTLSLQNHPVDLLLDAVPALVRREPRLLLLLVGGGEDLSKLQQRVSADHLQSVVRFTGHVSRSLLRVLLGVAEVTVDPVKDDAVARARSPLKIFESLALGVPVVTADVGDRRMLLADGRAGELVRPGDPSALAEGISHLLEDEPALRTKGERARAHVRAYDWDNLAGRFETVYG